jgi:hypothetical protein
MKRKFLLFVILTVFFTCSVVYATGVCKPCGKGFYKVEGMTQCELCGDGKTTDGEGSVSADQCKLSSTVAINTTPVHVSTQIATTPASTPAPTPASTPAPTPAPVQTTTFRPQTTTGRPVVQSTPTPITTQTNPLDIFLFGPTAPTDKVKLTFSVVLDMSSLEFNDAEQLIFRKDIASSIDMNYEVVRIVSITTRGRTRLRHLLAGTGLEVVTEILTQSSTLSDVYALVTEERLKTSLSWFSVLSVSAVQLTPVDEILDDSSSSNVSLVVGIASAVVISVLFIICCSIQQLCKKKTLRDQSYVAGFPGGGGRGMPVWGQPLQFQPPPFSHQPFAPQSFSPQLLFPQQQQQQQPNMPYQPTQYHQ